MSRNYCKDCGSHNTAPLSKKCVLESVTSCLYEMLKYSQPLLSGHSLGSDNWPLNRGGRL